MVAGVRRGSSVSPAGPKEQLAGPELRSLRRLLLIAGSVYLVWYYVVRAILPGAFNPFAGRLIVVLLFFSALGASFVSAAVRHRLDIVFSACAWLLTVHYYYLFHGNHGDMPWAIGAYVVVVAVAACLPSRRALFAYSALTVVLGAEISLLEPVLLRSIFLPGLVTMTLLANVSLHNRRLLEQEREGRIRAETNEAAAEAGVALRDEFITVASHELFTPLAALTLTMQGVTRTAERLGDVVDAASLARASLLGQRQVARLTRLADALLDASRLAEGRMPLRAEHVSLVEIVRDAADMLALDASRAECTIEIEGDDAIAGTWDRIRIEQVVTNLLRNAVVFGRGKPIHVTVSALAQGGARLVVADRGIGIAREEQRRIFERFERAVSAKNYGGMGLGLYIVKQIVDRHGGTVTVVSELGKGATFTVDLPATSA